MPTTTVLTYLALWSAIGCVLFSIYVVLVFKTGAVYTARKEDGTLKEKIPLSGLFNMLVLLLCIVGFLVAANYFGLVQREITLRFLPLLGLNYAHFAILFAFDTIAIDGLLLSVWRPAFLDLPEAMEATSMKKHILISLPVGLVAGLALSAISTVIAYFVWFN